MKFTLLDGKFPVFGSHDDNTLVQLRDVGSRAVHAAIMADGHWGYIMPVGGVTAYDNKVSVAGVGYDIACGNAAIRTDLHVDAILEHRNELADVIQDAISFGVGRSNSANDAPVEDSLFEDPAWDAISDISMPEAWRRLRDPKKSIKDQLKDLARNQIGTVGSGNHYVDVMADENGQVWVGVHFGSRGLGFCIASAVIAISADYQNINTHEALLPLDSPLGEIYWGLMALAGRYAYAGREWVTRKVVSILGGQELELVHNNHNFAWREQHEGRDLVVVRKGATPAFPGQKGFIGGSMGDNAVIVEGIDLEPEGQRAALYSTVHGAGRVMSRTEAKGKVSKAGVVKKVGRVTPEMMETWLKDANVVLRGGGLDESPHAYRRLTNVLREHENSVRVLHVLKPLIVVMAGANEFDPYKD